MSNNVFEPEVEPEVEQNPTSRSAEYYKMQINENKVDMNCEFDGLHYDNVREFAKQITEISYGILYRAGPYHKEGLYQTLLIHELAKRKFKTIRERVLNMTFTDSDGDEVFIGDNQSLRTDIELPDLRGILELKSTNAATKEENIWQLKHYLHQRKDIQWGLLINFISKFGKNSYPHVQVDILYPITRSTINEQLVQFLPMNDFDYEKFFTHEHILKVWTETLRSEMYPGQDQIFYDCERTFYMISDILYEEKTNEQENA